MFPSPRTVRLLLAGLVSLGVMLACAFPSPGTPEPGETAPPEGPAETEAPPGPGPEPAAAESLVVSFQGDVFNIYSLDGSLVETRPGTGMDYPRPNTAQVVGQSIYYVDSAGSGLGGVVRRVTSAGSTPLDFTASEAMASLSFAVSPDESRIAWTHSSWGDTGVTSQLYIANIDGSNSQMVVQSDPNDSLEEFYALEAVRWTAGGDLIYAWQVTGIGGYILFFGWSSFYRYSPASGTSTPLIPAGAGGTGPCWYTLSPDEAYAVGGCGMDGMRERELASGSDTVFPVLPNQGQQGAAAYSPSGARLAFAIARGEYDNESGQVVLRLNRGEPATVIATHSPGYFRAIRWVDEERMVVDYTVGEAGMIDVLNIDGTRSAVGNGFLIGLIQSAVATASPAEGLAGHIARGQLTSVRVTANGDIAGPGVEVVVHNPGPTEIYTTIPCGFVFSPGNAGDQRLMVVQEASATVPPGGEATLTAFVICIDPSSAAPDAGAGYALGGMESGDLLRLAECACQDELGGEMAFMSGMEVMLAAWTIRNQQSYTSIPDAEALEAMDQFFGEGSGDDLSGVLESFGDPAGGWLDRCGIQIP